MKSETDFLTGMSEIKGSEQLVSWVQSLLQSLYGCLVDSFLLWIKLPFCNPLPLRCPVICIKDTSGVHPFQLAVHSKIGIQP